MISHISVYSVGIVSTAVLSVCKQDNIEKVTAGFFLKIREYVDYGSENS